MDLFTAVLWPVVIDCPLIALIDKEGWKYINNTIYLINNTLHYNNRLQVAFTVWIFLLQSYGLLYLFLDCTHW